MVGVHAGKQALLIGVAHRSIEPVGLAHVVEGGMLRLSPRQGIAPLDADGRLARADGHCGVGVLPHQIPVVPGQGRP